MENKIKDRILTLIVFLKCQVNIQESKFLKIYKKIWSLVEHINSLFTNWVTVADAWEYVVHVYVVWTIHISKLIKVSLVLFIVIKGIYERFGRYVKTMGSGLQYFNPFTDKIHVVDMKTNIINLNRQKALTKDNI